MVGRPRPPPTDVSPGNDDKTQVRINGSGRRGEEELWQWGIRESFPVIPMVAGHSENEHAAAVDVANEEVDGGNGYKWPQFRQWI